MNIEKTISEHAVSDILTPMLESQDRIVTEDVAPLFDAATGLDTPPASGTVTTTIEESRSVITAIIRKAWTATLTMLCGASVISYITAAYTYLRNRLQGNETYGIPDRRSEISASSPLAANLALLNDRKISNGGAENDGIVDGVSMAHILGHRSMVTKIDDDNSGWVCDSVMPNFPNLGDATLRMGSITAANSLNNLGATGKVTLAGTKTITSGSSQYNDPMPLNATEIYADDVETSDAIFSQKSYPNLQKVSMKKVRSLNGRSFYDLQAEGPLKILIVPELRSYDTWSFLLDYSGAKDKYLSLIHLEIGSDVSCNLANWSPTNALDASRTDLIEEGSTAQNNLQQFLENFRSYIANRLTDNGSGKTLTLSQAVRNAIHAAEATYGIENIIITQKGWTISPAPN